MSEKQSKRTRKRKRTTAIWAVVLVVCLVGAAAGVVHIVSTMSSIRDVSNSHEIVPATPDPEEELPDNPVDFDALVKENPDTCAWVYVPGTAINHVVVQHAQDDAYYLTHDATGEYNRMGAVFAEQINARDFSDPVTILYGHNWITDEMFTSLHWFEDRAFFDENDTIYVYTPGHVLTYRIVSAFTTDDAHLMYRYHAFESAQDVEDFHKVMLEPNSIAQNVREGVTLDANSRVVVLSTCNTGALEQYGRYLVCGVMVDDQKTS